ncbi:desmoglein-2-like protein [Lates japonicus]|uniref:Desmoglein-2-like protein n=1 Tax=Lates japonicus TaxID=270547 RepID=A0AAD3MIA4_LATJO|nr:desmoglein-2-like protein [Lates japonicus]
MPGKTSTGTVAIQVEDFNDHCPKLTSGIQTMCTTDNAVIVNAKDEDAFPNGPPFHFSIVSEGTEGKWHVEHLNDTAAILRAKETLWPGSYEVEFEVKDEQGEACPEPQKVKVQVCTCEDGVVCGKRGSNGQPNKGAELGPAGIGLLFLGLLLLVLHEPESTLQSNHFSRRSSSPTRPAAPPPAPAATMPSHAVPATPAPDVLLHMPVRSLQASTQSSGLNCLSFSVRSAHPYISAVFRFPAYCKRIRGCPHSPASAIPVLRLC